MWSTIPVRRPLAQSCDHRRTLPAPELSNLRTSLHTKLGVKVRQWLVHQEDGGKRTIARLIATLGGSPPDKALSLLPRYSTMSSILAA